MRLDGGSLKAGDRGDGYRVIAVLEQAGQAPLFDDPGRLAEAEHERDDALILLPRDRRPGPWEASVAVELGRRIARTKDPRPAGALSRKRGAEAAGVDPDHPVCRPRDGRRQDEEECDDGNRDGGDGSAYCFAEKPR